MNKVQLVGAFTVSVEVSLFALSRLIRAPNFPRFSPSVASKFSTSNVTR